MSSRLIALALVLVLCARVILGAQSPAPLAFEVVSIKRNLATSPGGSGRTSPDGTQRLVNMPIRNFIQTASPMPVTEVVGLPSWAITERYDVQVKPPAGSTREQQKQMWQAMWADRFKFAGHIEQRQRDIYTLVVARRDRTLGPQLKPSTLDCSTSSPAALPATGAAALPTEKEALSLCATMLGSGSIVSGGMTLDWLARTLKGPAGGEVENETGLDGLYSVELRFSRPRSLATPESAVAPDDAPTIFTAVQEQLGLRLVPGKKIQPVLVVDHIERPSEN